MAPEAEDAVDASGKRPLPAGIIVIDKPTGPTSRELVDGVAALLPQVKVGTRALLTPWPVVS